MKDIIKNFKSELTGFFDFLDNGENILVDSEIFLVDLINYDLEPTEARIVINEILISDDTRIIFTIIVSKFDENLNDQIIATINKECPETIILLTEERSSGEVKALQYEFII